MRQGYIASIGFVAGINLLLSACSVTSSSPAGLPKTWTTSPSNLSPKGMDKLMAEQSGRDQGGDTKILLEDLSLRDAVGLAIVRHPSVARAGAVVSRGQAELSIAEAAWYPNFVYGAGPGLGSAGVATADATVDQLLYDFGRTPNAIAKANAIYSQNKHELADNIEAVAEQTAQYYIEVSASKKLMQAAERHLKTLRETRSRIQDRYNAGAANNSDVALADVIVQRGLGDLLKAKTKRDVAEDKLMRVIGVRPQEVASLTELQNLFKNATKTGDVETAPSVLSSLSALQAARANKDLVKAERYPALRARAAYSYVTDGDVNLGKTWIGLKIEGSFSTGGLQKSRISAAEAEFQAALQALNTARLSVRTEQVSAGLESAGARSRIAVYDKMIQLARGARKLYWEEYTLDRRPLIEVLNAEREVFSAESERINAESDELRSAVRAIHATGNLVNELKKMRK